MTDYNNPRDLSNVSDEEATQILEEGGERFKEKGFYYALNERDLPVKAAAMRSIEVALGSSMDAIKADDTIHVPLHVVEDHQGDFVVVGSATKPGAEILLLVMQVMNGVDHEQVVGMLSHLRMLMAVNDDDGDLIDQMLADLLDKGDQPSQDGPNAS